MEPEPFQEGDHVIKNSGKMLALDAILRYCHRNKHRVLIFSQMVRMLDVVQDYATFRGLSLGARPCHLAKRRSGACAGFSYERLDGSVRSEERYACISRFNSAERASFCFLLSTRAGGQGLNLVAADTVVFLDSDFNPQNDLQAAARVHRIGQTRCPP